MFVLRPTIRLSTVYFEVRQYMIGCINHDIEVDLFSELLKILSYYIQLAFGNSKKLVLSRESNPEPYNPEPPAVIVKPELLRLNGFVEKNQ